MLFPIGTKVKFLHTSEEGVVRALLDNGMISVYLPDDDMEIPAHPDDLIRADGTRSSPVKTKVVEKKKEKPKPTPPKLKIETQYTILKSVGIQLAFVPVQNAEGLTVSFTLFLLNDTQYDVVYDLRMLLNYKTASWNGKLPPTAYVELGSMLYDDLNEAPEFEAEINWITTAGKEPSIFKILKVKPKSFFKSVRTAPLLNQTAHLYRLFPKPSAEPEKKEEDLSTYTRRHAKPVWYKGGNLISIDAYDSSELAHFEPEIDLHIDQLRENWKKLSNGEILAIQLSVFDEYINKALRMGVPSVFIIHGVGKGKLRNEIATRLMQHQDVETFKNEYHPKYGWGATEVIFKMDE